MTRVVHALLQICQLRLQYIQSKMKIRKRLETCGRRTEERIRCLRRRCNLSPLVEGSLEKTRSQAEKKRQAQTEADEYPEAADLIQPDECLRAVDKQKNALHVSSLTQRAASVSGHLNSHAHLAVLDGQALPRNVNVLLIQSILEEAVEKKGLIA